jgi:hypothetical protein
LILLLSVSISALGQYTGGNPNVAAFKFAFASDSVAGFGSVNAVDNSLVTYATIPGDAPQWLQINLGTYHTIDGFGLVIPNADELPEAITFQSSVYGSWWSNLRNIDISAPGTYTFDLDDRDSVKYIRLYISDKHPYTSITEVYVYGVEMTPPASPPMAQPPTNITGTSFTANWSERASASGYNLSVSTEANFLTHVPGYDNLDVGNTLSWDVTGLTPLTTYYYRVRAYNIVGSTNNGNSQTATLPQATQTITFDTLAAHQYGDDDFVLEAVASSGLPVSYVSSDETVATISGSTVTVVGVGITDITASQEGDAQYLPASPVSNALVVNRKELTVTGTVAASKDYDATNVASLSNATLEGVLGTEDVILSSETTGTFAQVDVGTAIAVTTSMEIIGTDVDNYTLIQPDDIVADITPKELTVTADDMNREECAPNPEFTISYTGFAGTENADVLDSEPVAECTADEASPPGAYDITVSGGSAGNYALVYVTGALTINPDITDPVLTVQNIIVQLDSTGNASITPADVVANASDNCSLSDTTLSQSSFTSSDVGFVFVDVTVTDMAGNSTTEAVTVTVEEGSTGIEDLEGFGTSFYPNPVSDILTIETDQTTELSVKITSLNGQVIEDRNFTGNLHQIDLSSVQKGVYIITVRSADFITTKKIVKW